MDYTIVVEKDPIKFQEKVLALLADGWELQGGVSVALSESDDFKYIIFTQALIKKAFGISKRGR
jgi:hypothetical protein